MAKGIEDTAFYRWHRLVALNEVGGDPDLLDDGAPEQMHAWAVHQQQHWPLGMTALSTHDTKRSEDVRARLLAVAGDAETWERCTDAFAEAAAERGVDAPTAHLVWQTLVGVGPIDDERLTGYLTKAIREAKQHTSWLDADPDYEARVMELAGREPARSAARPGRAARRRQRRGGARHGARAEAAAADAARGAGHLPGQRAGRPVARGPRQPAAGRLPAPPGPAGAVGPRRRATSTTRSCWSRIARWRCAASCRTRSATRGDYQPLVGTSRHLVGFVRGGEVATLVTRAASRLEVAGGWDDATVTLPEGLWRDELPASCTAAPRTAAPTCSPSARWPCCARAPLMSTPTLWAPYASARRAGHRRPAARR